MRLVNTYIQIFILGFLILSIPSCKKEAVPKPSDFNKSQREYLGEQIKEAIYQNTETFQILDQSSYSETYTFLNKIYSQAYNSYLIDYGAPDDNKWNSDRKWKIHIINDTDNKTCFIIPGGDLFISTHFLNSLESESELYYLLAFEATLMNENYLLNRLFTEYGTVDLKNIINDDSSNLTVQEIALAIKDLNFESDIVATIDENTVRQICNSSLYVSNSIQFFLQEFDIDDQWINTRSSYSDRVQILNQIGDTPGLDCGSLITNGSYETLVLDKLP